MQSHRGFKSRSWSASGPMVSQVIDQAIARARAARDNFEGSRGKSSADVNKLSGFLLTDANSMMELGLQICLRQGTSSGSEVIELFCVQGNPSSESEISLHVRLSKLIMGAGIGTWGDSWVSPRTK